MKEFILSVALVAAVFVMAGVAVHSIQPMLDQLNAALTLR